MEYYKNLDLADIKYFCEFDQVWKIEEWKEVKYFESFYQISDLGRLKSLSRIRYISKKDYYITKEKILTSKPTNRGYIRASLYGNKNIKISIHQLVAISFFDFIPNGQELVVNHKNFIKTDNRKLNLEIITNRENSNKKHLKSSSDYTGVSFDINSQKFTSHIFINRRLRHLGVFNTEKEASQYYENALLAIKNGTEILVKKPNFSSKYKGVHFDKKRNKYVSKIKIKGKSKHLGYFINEIDAHNSYQEALANIT